MKTKLWRLRDKVFKFPFSWNKTQVVNFANQDFKICPYCDKVDISLNHLNTCISSIQQQELITEQFYK